MGSYRVSRRSEFISRSVGETRRLVACLPQRIRRAVPMHVPCAAALIIGERAGRDNTDVSARERIDCAGALWGGVESRFGTNDFGTPRGRRANGVWIGTSPRSVPLDSESDIPG